MVRIMPIHLDQNTTVKALPRIMHRRTGGTLTAASMASHLVINTPKGGSSMEIMPNTVTKVVKGIFFIRPCIISISRLPISSSMVPTQRNRRALEKGMEEKKKKGASQCGRRPNPRATDVKPQVEMVE